MSHRCAVCGSTFQRARGLEMHAARKTPCKLAVITPSPLTCLACGRAFSRKDSLTRHGRRCKIQKGPVNVSENVRFARLEQQVEELTNLVTQVGAAGAPGLAPGLAPACVMNAHTMNVMQNTNIINVNSITIAPWGSPLQLTDADVEAALATVPGLAGTPALPEVVAALMELVKRAHMPPAARNVHLNPKRTDQALALTTGGWAAMPLEEATAALFDGASASMAAARMPSVRQMVRTSIPVQYRAERAASVQLGLRPMGAHLLNVAPGGPGPLLLTGPAEPAGAAAATGATAAAQQSAETASSAFDAIRACELLKSHPAVAGVTVDPSCCSGVPAGTLAQLQLRSNGVALQSDARAQCKTLAEQMRVKLFNFFARPLAAGAPRAGGGGGVSKKIRIVNWYSRCQNGI